MRLLFSHDEPTVCWENPKNKEKMRIISRLWIFDKYKNYPEIVKYMGRTILFALDNLEFINQEELLKELVNELSYESLNMSKEELGMKARMVCGGLLIVLLGVMSMVSCKTDDDNVPKKVDEKLRGQWRNSESSFLATGDYWWSVNITETEFKQESSPGSGNWRTCPAWSEGNFLYIHYEFCDYKYELKGDGSLELLNPDSTNPWQPAETLIKKTE